MRFFLVISILICAGVTAFADPKPLSKADATKILESMGYQDIKIAFIIQGAVPMAATQNAAIVTAVAYFNGKPQKLEQQFFYDADIGWLCTENRSTGVGVRMWSLTGYSEVVPTPRMPTTQSMPHFTPDPQIRKGQDAEVRLNDVYTRLRSKLSDAEKLTLKAEQLHWLQTRDDPSTSPAQRIGMTESRITELEGRINK